MKTSDADMHVTAVRQTASEQLASTLVQAGAADASESALGRMERDNEALIAGLRAIVLVVLIGIFWWTGAAGRDHTVMFSLAGFGAVTLASLALVAIGFYRPWLPWVFATLDVGVLIHCLAMFAIAMRMPASDMLNGPGAWLIFLYLAMAAVRYRPFLVLYSGLLFGLGWIAVWLIAHDMAPSGASGMDHGATDMGAAFAGEVARFAVMTVTIFALVLMTTRTRRSVRTALAETRLRATLARYFAGSVVGQLAQLAESGVRLRDQHAAVLFADIRGFTALAENMLAGEVAQLLNEYRDRIAAPIATHGGTIDKFIGDGVMVVFGVPRPGPEDARNAVRCGLALQAAVAAWNQDRAREGRAAIAVGIGIHFGPVVAGVLGERDRLEFTVIGDTVNVADRIEKHAAQLGLSILVSSEVLESARDERAAWELVGDLALRGRSRTVRLYALRSELDAVQQNPGRASGAMSAASPVLRGA